MRTRPNILQAAILLAAIAMLIGLVGCLPEGMALDPQTGRLVTVTPPLSPIQTPPPPIATSVSGPTPIIVTVQPGQEPPAFPTVAWTPFPTFPPPPTPTRRPGPTATPLPLPQPAKDAEGIITYVARENNTMAVYSISMDTAGLPRSSPTRLPSEAQASWGLVYPAPDGSRLAIVGEWGGRRILYTNSGKVEPLFRESLDPQGLFFNWHPDSRQVLIRAQQNYTDVGLWLVDVDSGEHTTLVIDFPSPKFSGGAVSPDGQRVVYSVQKDIFSSGELWLINADGSDPRLLFTSGAVISAIAWSPDGSKIAFLGDGLVVIDAGGSNPRTLTHNFGGGYLFRPVWSPDSRTIAFVSVDGSNPLFEKGRGITDWDIDAFKGSDIHLIDVATGTERPLLADGSTGNIDPAWSPDGSQITFASFREGQAGLWAINVDGNSLRELAEASDLIRFPVWTR